MWVLTCFILFCAVTAAIGMILLSLENNSEKEIDKKDSPKLSEITSMSFDLIDINDDVRRWKDNQSYRIKYGYPYFTGYSPDKSKEITPYDIKHFLLCYSKEIKDNHIGKSSELVKKRQVIDEKIDDLLTIKNKLLSKHSKSNAMKSALEQAMISLEKHESLRKEINDSISKIDVIYSKIESKIYGLDSINDQYMIIKSLEEIDSEIDIEIEEFDKTINRILSDIRTCFDAITKGVEQSKTMFVIAGAENKSIPINYLGE